MRTARGSTSSSAGRHPASSKPVFCQPWERGHSTPHRNGLSTSRDGHSSTSAPARSKHSARHGGGCLQLGRQPPGTAPRSSWIIPGAAQTGNVMLQTTVARLWEERSPRRGANSCKSTAAEHSQPSQLREEPWHQVQTQIFPSPVSAAAQTADGIAQTPLDQPSPFSFATAMLRL